MHATDALHGSCTGGHAQGLGGLHVVLQGTRNGSQPSTPNDDGFIRSWVVSLCAMHELQLLGEGEDITT